MLDDISPEKVRQLEAASDELAQRFLRVQEAVVIEHAIETGPEGFDMGVANDAFAKAALETARKVHPDLLSSRSPTYVAAAFAQAMGRHMLYAVRSALSQGLVQ